MHQELYALHIRHVASTALRYWRLWVDVRADVEQEKAKASNRYRRLLMKQW